MSTLTGTLSFTSDAEGLSDAGSTGNITFAHEPADGSPSSGCVKFTTSTNNQNNVVEYGRSGTGINWESLFGVPAGATVNSFQITGWKQKVASDGGLTNFTTKMRLVDSGTGAIIHGSDLISHSAVPYSLGSWEDQAAGSSRSIDSGKQASTTQIRWELEWRVFTQIAGTNVDARFDAIAWSLDYTGSGALSASPSALAKSALVFPAVPAIARPSLALPALTILTPVTIQQVSPVALVLTTVILPVVITHQKQYVKPEPLIL